MSRPIKINQSADAPFAGSRKGKSVSIKDVADKAGVSIATVSRVINDEAAGVSEETRNRVRQFLDELGYRPNHAGRSLRAQSNDTYALVISNIQNAFYAAVAWELERILNDSGKVMLFFNSNENAALQNRRYSAIYCGGDLIAYGVYRHCRELGLRVPEDVRIYGFDDNPLNEWLAPWLNTLRVPHVGMASAAIDQLLKLKDGGPHRATILPYDIGLRT